MVVEEVKTERVADQPEFAGFVEAVRQVEVRSPVAGVIVAEPIDEGAEVKAGAVLFRIDPANYDAALRGALARQAQSQSATRQCNANARPPAAAPRRARRGTKDVDDAETESSQARAAVEDAKASVDRARKDSTDANVKAEISGRVGRANLKLGARVTGPNDLLTTIDVLDPVRIDFRPSTQQVLAWRRDPKSTAALRPGSNARVQILLPDGSTLPDVGKIDFVDPVVDPATGTQTFRAEVANHARLLVPGQFVRVRLQGLVRENAILIPQRAVVQSLGHQSVFVLGAGDTVQMHDVVATAWVGERWLIDSGLVAGDRVIVDGVQKVRPGGLAKPMPAAPATDAPAGPATGKPASAPRGEAVSESAAAPKEIRYFFIRRPVMAGVIALGITLLGLFSLRYMPVNRYPSITPPSIRITAVYPGATAEDVAQAVAAPIEQQLSGLPGLLYYKSSNASDGTMSLQVFFDISRSQDLAAVDVQNAVKLAEPQLPGEVTRNGVVITKAQTDILLVAALSSNDPRYDANYLTNYASLYIVDDIKRLPGVGDAQVFGGGRFAGDAARTGSRQAGATGHDGWRCGGRGARTEQPRTGWPYRARTCTSRDRFHGSRDGAGPAYDRGRVPQHHPARAEGRLPRPRQRRGDGSARRPERGSRRAAQQQADDVLPPVSAAGSECTVGEEGPGGQAHADAGELSAGRHLVGAVRHDPVHLGLDRGGSPRRSLKRWRW